MGTYYDCYSDTFHLLTSRYSSVLYNRYMTIESIIVVQKQNSNGEYIYTSFNFSPVRTFLHVVERVGTPVIERRWHDGLHTLWLSGGL